MEWHYLKDGRQYGPVPESSVRAWCASGFLKPEDLVWRSGMPEWTPIAAVPELGGSPGGSFGLPGGSFGLPGGAQPGLPFGATEPPPAGIRAYAGFGPRLLAYLIDSLLLTLVMTPIWLPMLRNSADPEKIATDSTFLGVGFFAALVYFAVLESSPWQATLGKKALHLKVTDLEGRRISLLRAMLRHVSKMLSGMILYLGYVMIGFTPRRQGLHDMVAGCLVVLE